MNIKLKRKYTTYNGDTSTGDGKAIRPKLQYGTARASNGNGRRGDRRVKPAVKRTQVQIPVTTVMVVDGLTGRKTFQR